MKKCVEVPNHTCRGCRHAQPAREMLIDEADAHWCTVSIPLPPVGLWMWRDHALTPRKPSRTFAMQSPTERHHWYQQPCHWREAT